MLVSVCNVGVETIGWKKVLHLTKEAGFEAMDYQLVDWLKYAEGSEEEFNDFLAGAADLYKEVRMEADRIGLKIGQTHAPFPTQVYGGDAEFNRRMLELEKKAVEVTSILGAPYMVMHSIIPDERIYDDFKEECKALNMDFYAKIIPYLKKFNVKLGVENLWQSDRFYENKKISPTVCSTPEEIIDFIDTINGMAGCEVSVACLDVGHCELYGIQPWVMIRKLGKYLKVLHTHDVIYNDDTHTIPLLGQINWDRTVKALKEVGYDGTFNFEVQKPFSMFPLEVYPDVLKLMSSIGHYFVKNYNL